MLVEATIGTGETVTLNASRIETPHAELRVHAIDGAGARAVGGAAGGSTVQFNTDRDVFWDYASVDERRAVALEETVLVIAHAQHDVQIARRC